MESEEEYYNKAWHVTLEELKYLRFFYEVADFGPAHGDVVMIIQNQFKTSGGTIPEGYEYE